MAKDYNPSRRNREAFEALAETPGNVPPQAVELEEAVLGALMLVLLRGNYAYKAISQYGFSNWLDTQLDSPVYMVLTILIVAGLLAGGIASMISVRREGKKIEELKRRRMIEE